MKTPVSSRSLFAVAIALLVVGGLLPATAGAATKNLTLPVSTNFATTTVGFSSTEKVTLKNASEEGVNVSEVKIEGADAGDFGIDGNNCVGYIGAGQDCELSLRFTPGAPGAREAQLKVFSDGEVGESITTLSGEGAAAELTFEPGSFDFGLVEAHNGSPRTTLTLRNTGVASVQLSNLEVSGPQADEFFISGGSCSGATLVPGASCSIEIQFDANAEGASAAAVRVAAGPVTFEAPLSGEAERPKVQDSPAPLDFGTVAVGGSATRTVTLTNTGRLPVAFFIAIVSGGDVSSFHMLEETCTSNIFSGHPRVFEPGESCAATVRFEPTAAGARKATLSFFGVGEGALQVSAEGTASPAQVGLTPASRDFGSVAVGSTGPTQSFELRNESASPVAVDSATLVGADLGDFQIRADECGEAVLAPGAACAVTVRFQPDSTGPKSATLRVRGAAGVSVAELSGDGAAPASSERVSGARAAGRVAVRFRARPARFGGKFAIGRAGCASREDCTLVLTGHLGGAPLATQRIKIPAGSSAPLTIEPSATRRGAPSAAALGVVARWQTGSHRGARGRVFRLG